MLKKKLELGYKFENNFVECSIPDANFSQLIQYPESGITAKFSKYPAI